MSIFCHQKLKRNQICRDSFKFVYFIHIFNSFFTDSCGFFEKICTKKIKITTTRHI